MNSDPAYSLNPAMILMSPESASDVQRKKQLHRTSSTTAAALNEVGETEALFFLSFCFSFFSSSNSFSDAIIDEDTDAASARSCILLFPGFVHPLINSSHSSQISEFSASSIIESVSVSGSGDKCPFKPLDAPFD